ncbi:MAG: precorrin-2 C(20)-methyltransferase [Cyanobacteria bacterium J06553_1]
MTQPTTPPTNSDKYLGTLYGIGVGPGDPELLTLKALRRLQSSPVVAFPAGLNGQVGVAERIITPWLADHQQRLPLSFPYVLEAEQLSAAWQQAAQTVWPYLCSGDVVFACEGDVSFYGTFTYLAQSLRLQHPEVVVEAIAGVSSPMAAAAALGIPLACQSQRLAVLPALYAVDELKSALAWADVIVLMKVSSVYSQVWQVLAERQLLERSYVVKNATRPDQKTYSGLQDYPDLKLPYFSLLVVQCGQRIVVTA